MCAVRVLSVVCSIAILCVAYYLYRHIYYKMYTFSELLNMHFCYSAADSKRTMPSAKTFWNIDQRLRDTGTLKPAKPGGRTDQVDPKLGDKILHHIHEN